MDSGIYSILGDSFPKQFFKHLVGFLYYICQTIYIPADKIPEEKELWAEYN